MIRCFSFLIVFLLAAPVHANSEWFMVTPATSNPTAVQMADGASVRGNGTEVEVWTHLFYAKPQGRLKSYLLQVGINCVTRQMRERRFIDFDASYEVIESGDNTGTESGEFSSVAPTTIGDLVVTFACETSAYRQKNFLSVDSAVDYRQVAEFFLERGELVKTK